MAASKGNWTTLTLYTTPEKFYLQPNETTAEVLVLDRINRTIDIQNDLTRKLPSDTIGRHVYGIFGIARLIAGPYLIVITRVDRLGELNGQVIYRIADTEIIPFRSHPTSHLTEKQQEFNATYLSMLRATLETPNFYFSYTYDLTRPLQWAYTQDGGPILNSASTSLFSRADPIYTWNSHLLHDISAREELIKFCIPIIHGFVSINSTQVSSRPVKWSLVTRRAITRAGCRLFRRGLDEQGHVANQVLTEQILECHAGKSSLVQLRGSIPLFWHQTPNLKYKPPPVPLTGMDHLTGFSSHLDALTETHGRIHMVSLIDHTGKEQPLNKLLSDTVQSYDSGAVKYESFDFHHECRKMRWDRLSILLDRIKGDVADYGFFMVTADSSLVVQYQEGVVRTNCIDSLDRTNVVQSMVAQISLEAQLARFGIISAGETLQKFDGFWYLYRNVWADHADAVSVQYSGTPALKTDFTRTGKRTRAGLIQDGLNSLTRYYKNNFADGFRQDGIDLMLGNYRVQEGEGSAELRCPLEESKSLRTMALPIILIGSIAMFFLTLFLPAESLLETLLFMLFWCALIAASGSGIIRWGPDFVDFPKLTSHYLINPVAASSGVGRTLKNATPVHENRLLLDGLGRPSSKLE